jgi:hypothetical protein
MSADGKSIGGEGGYTLGIHRRRPDFDGAFVEHDISSGRAAC